jgi:DNA repair protein RecO (recombination protein O)
MVRFELMVLEDLGFGLDLDQCALTGGREDLAYVSPKSGRAVCRTAGEPWRERLLALPSFLSHPSGERRDAGGLDVGDLAAAFRLTRFFFAKHVYEPRGIDEPGPRAAFVAAGGRRLSEAANSAPQPPPAPAVGHLP